ncbi:THO complex subunit 2 isoform X2 [Magnolia sinica]|uniref:THO complex subunit 2 isoform X2 n=1 Tax=Magnolia sinica TaxID=86752 RepID=UPI002659E99F|nr:THO complex subunit 2 isoform X2 [Magnolia sinica]
MSVLSTEYKYLTEDCVREWKNSSSNFKLPNPVPTLRFLYELCSTIVRGELPLQKCKAIVESVEFSDKQSKEEMASIFADIVAQMGQDLTMPVEYRVRLVKMAKWLVDSALVPLRLFHERCEEEFLWESEMCKMKAQEVKGREVRVNTRLLYQQTKFNLLREESEGYAKLVTLLCESGSEVSTRSTSAAKISIIKSLIGHFDLDPNRVFDIVLECFELQPDNSIFFDLIPIFPKSHASQILGFKFQYYQRMEVNGPVPFGLYRLTAMLVKLGFIDLDSIYAHLLPKDDEAFEHYSAFSAKRFDEANKIGKINLAATGKDLMDDEKQGDVTIDFYAALDMENEAVAERVPELANNQSLGLLTGFLSVDDWCHAHIMLERLSPLSPVAHIQICERLFRIIEKSISSAYATVCETHLRSFGLSLGPGSDPMESKALSLPQSSFIDLPRELFQMLASAGPYLYRDAVLLQKVCRVLRGYYLSALELVGTSGAILPESGDGVGRDPRPQLREARLRVEEALGTCLLPSLQLIPANPAVGQEIWELMSLLPYEARYRLYGEWEKDDERIPMVLAARQTAKLDTRRILKRLAKENLKQLGRMVAKLAHANPMTVLRTIVHQIEAYRDMITPVVDAFKYLTQLEYDVLEYVVIERLAQGGREKLKDDGLNLSDWLQSLASFWGHLCKKYPSMELRGLFQYLVNQLKKGTGIELVLLQELIQQMANVQYTENMTEEQLDSMAGSETLRYQATSFGITRNNKALIKSTNRLRDSLLPKEEPKLAIPLLLLIAQHRSMVVTNADAPYIKMVSEQFDRCHGTLLQYVEFLYSAVTPATAYAQLIPPLDDLVHKYHLDPEVAFLIYRPVMRLFKSSSGSEVFWPSDVVEEANMLNSDKDSESLISYPTVVLDLGSPRKPILWSDLLDTVRSILPSKAWNSLSPDLYATFWGLTLYDLYVPRNRYESEIAKQHAALKALEELSDNSNSAITKRKKEKERIQELLDRLTGELQKHEENVASVRQRLAREKDKWLSSCPDTLKINMEFLQRCIFPRCIFSMPDAVYCAMFVHTLHSLGTPFFNTVNHIDVLICKTLQPMICCCTEFEAGRLGRFLYETLKMAYHWKSDESIYERECGNMPGFAVYYRYPNSQRVTFSQFIRVHWKWSQRITRLLIQCLESAEYMEIRNALILLTKISGVFPVTRKSGINLEKRVAKIKGDEREDLKVLATGVAAALAARKSSWISEEEFSMGHVDLKPVASPAKSLASHMVPMSNGSALNNSQNENAGSRNTGVGTQLPDSLISVKDPIPRTKPADGRPERSESITHMKTDSGQLKLRGGASANGADFHSILPSTVQPGTSRPGTQKVSDEHAKGQSDENMAKVVQKVSVDSEARPQTKRSVQAGSLTKQQKQELMKDDLKTGKSVSRTAGPITSGDKDLSAHQSESKQGGTASASLATNNGGTSSVSSKIPTAPMRMESGAVKSTELRVSSGKDMDDAEIPEVSRPPPSRPAQSPLRDDSSTASKSADKQQKRTSPAEEPERLNKRRKGDTDANDGESVEIRLSGRDRTADPRQMDKSHIADLEKSGSDDQNHNRLTDKLLDRSKDKGNNERYDRDHKERLERLDKSRGEDLLVEKTRDRSIERYGRERSIERMQERGTERSFDRASDKSKDDRNRDDRNKSRYNENLDDRFHGQSLPPPPPLPPNLVPQSVSVSRRDEEDDRRVGSSRHVQRLSPRHAEKERRRSEESLVSQDDAKRRREDDFRERKRDERDGMSMKVEERERDKGNMSKEDIETTAASKRRKLKRDHLSPAESGGEYPLAVPPPLPLTVGISPQQYDGRDSGDRKGAMVQRGAYMDDPVPRMHGKEAASKIARRDNDPLYERDWEEEKRPRAEPKRRHRK